MEEPGFKPFSQLMTCVENMNRKFDFLINEVNDSKHTRLNELTVLEEISIAHYVRFKVVP